MLLPRALRPRGAACDDENTLPSTRSVAASEAIRTSSSAIVQTVRIQRLSEGIFEYLQDRSIEEASDEFSAQSCTLYTGQETFIVRSVCGTGWSSVSGAHRSPWGYCMGSSDMRSALWLIGAKPRHFFKTPTSWHKIVSEAFSELLKFLGGHDSQNNALYLGIAPLHSLGAS